MAEPYSRKPGLERGDPLSLGSGSVLMLGVTAAGLAFSGLTPFSVLAGMFPGANLLAMLGIGLLLSLIVGSTHAIIGRLVRRNGADYVLAARVIHPGAAFAFSLTLVLAAALFSGAMLAYGGQAVLLSLARALAGVSGDASWTAAAEAIAAPPGVSTVGAVGVGLAFLLSILPPRWNLSSLRIGALLLALAWGVVLFMLLAPAGSFAASWERMLAGESVNPSAGGMGGSASPLSGGLLAAAWLSYAFMVPASAAGQIKRAERSLLQGTNGAAVLVWLVFGAAAILLQRLVPPDWLSAQSILALSGAQGTPWLPFYAAAARPAPLLVVLVALFWLFSLINTAQAIFGFIARTVQAWLADRLAPPALGYIHPLLRTPLFTILAAALVAQVGALSVALGTDGTLSPFTFLFVMAAAQLLPAAALLRAPFARKTWFEGANGNSAKERIPRGLIVLASGLTLGILLAGWAAGWAQPFLAREMLAALALTLVFLALGFAGYVLRRRAVPGLEAAMRFFPPPED